MSKVQKEWKFNRIGRIGCAGRMEKLPYYPAGEADPAYPVILLYKLCK